MKIKRVFAKDMRQAMRMVRDEHGDDAVILSSRNVEGGVEVISAMDYDERAVRAAAQGTTPAAEAKSRPPPAPRRSAGRLSVTVGDDDDDIPALAFDDALACAAPAPEPTSSAATAAGRVEWTQEPAMQAMREELRILRSLFENQVSLMQWQETGKRNPVRATLLRRLHELGLGSDVARKLAGHVRETEDPERAWSDALRIVAHNLAVTDDDIVERGGVVAVVGPTGVGKTTTVAKLAARYALRHGKRHVALITTDNFRIGGQEQLRSFARLLGVPVYAASDGEELGAVLDDLCDKRLVLVDTAGMSQRDMRLVEHFQTLRGAGHSIRPCLVVSANTQITALTEILQGFRDVAPVGCIVSKVDEATSLGGFLTAMLRSRLPIAYLTTGQRVPEDLQVARSDRLLEEAQHLMQRYARREDDEALAVAFAGAR